MPITRILTAGAWALAVILVSLGSAGLVSVIDAPRAGTTDPALTAAGDARLAPMLDAAEAELGLVRADVEALSAAARRALAALAGSDLDEVEAAVTEGDGLIAAVRTRSAALAADLAAMPIVGSPTAEFELSPEVRARHARLAAAIGATDGLDAAWSRLTTSSLSASRLASALDAHVEAVARATALGREGAFDRALAALDEAAAQMATARELRDLLARTVEVSTLDAWLDRSEAYDATLVELYGLLRDSDGRMTDAVRAAVAAEEAARDRLPPDRRAMVVIMADIGRGGMNGAVIAIEEARGALVEALRTDS